MMAAVGAVAQHYITFPGFESVPKGLGAAATAPGSFGFAALFLVSGLLELGAWTESPDKEPGNFGDPAGLNQYTEEMRLREINNGRFAMFSAIGIIAAELYTGKDAIEQFGLGAMRELASQPMSSSAFAGHGVVSAPRSGSTMLRAEPVSAAAAAAAAAGKAAAGAKAAAAGAKAAGGAVGAGAGTGKSVQTEEEMAPNPSFDPSTQLGAMAPLGFFDPLGFSKVHWDILVCWWIVTCDPSGWMMMACNFVTRDR